MKYLFGPVNSRRLGISLGIDLLPFKTCSLNCVYCECGITTHLTAEIDEYVPADEVIAELNQFLKDKPELDSITFAGSGEPTLHSGIGKIIKYLKNNFPEYKISILTNSTLLYIKKVREAILDADVIYPSLDAASEGVFKKISRPENSLTVDQMIRGLFDLRREFKNTINLEIFIIPGLNDNENELKLIKDASARISPDKIQLNTLDRPGTEKWIRPATYEELQKIKLFFEPLKVEIISSPKARENNLSRRFIDISEAVIATIARRPSTLDDLSLSLGIRIEGISKIIEHLLEKDIIAEEKNNSGNIFYKLKRQD